MKKRINPDWIIVGTSFITLALAYGVFYSFSVFFVALLKEFGWSRSLATAGFSLFIVSHGMVGPFVGGFIGRFGARTVIIIGSLLLGAGLALCSFTQTWWHFYLFFGILTALGVGSIGWVPNTTMIQQWFKEGRGLAMGIIASGIGVGILVCVPSIQYLILQVGWRRAYQLIALFIPLIIITMVITLLRKSPHQATAPEPSLSEKKTLLQEGQVQTRQPLTVRGAIATKEFWFINLSSFLGNFAIQAIFTHQVAFFVDEGLETLLASSIAGAVGIVSIGGKILWGSLSDRIGREATYTIGIACFVLGMIILILFSRFHFPNLIYPYVFFFALGYAVTAALPALFTADFFEGQTYGSIFGIVIIFNSIGGALGAWFTGFLYDEIGSYIPAIVIVMAAVSLSSLSLWVAAPRKKRVNSRF